MPEELAPVGAACPLHPDRPAIGACSRCGTFLCGTCAIAREPLLCRPCREKQRNALAIDLGPFSIGSAVTGGWTLFTGCASGIVAYVAVFAVPGGLVSYFTLGLRRTSPFVASFVPIVYLSTVALLRTLACLAMMTAKAEGREMTFGGAFVRGASRWGSVFVARLLAGIQVGLYSLLLIVPGIVQAVKLSLVTPVAFLEADDPSDRSRALVSGRGWEMAGLLAVSVIGSGLINGAVRIAAVMLSPGLAPIAAPAISVFASGIEGLTVTLTDAFLLAAFYTLRVDARAEDAAS